jgi:DNA polymerase I-like protein with 3'-5' exonuclease and polymerase domains
MRTIALVDYGKTRCTEEVLSILEDVLTEAGFSHDYVSYYHIDQPEHIAQVKGDVVVAFGAEAMRKLCNVNRDLREYAGCLTWNEDMGTWVLPTYHPNGIYQEKYDEFDSIYDHLRRAVDLCTGLLAFPPKDGPDFEWEWIGHNGEGWDWKQGYNPEVWSGYFEATQDEVGRAYEVLYDWINRLDACFDGLTETFSIDTESYNLNHFQPLTMIQVFDPKTNKAWAFNWGVIERIRTLWERFLNHENARWVLHNTKHDRKMLRHWLNVDLGDRDIDTMCYALGLTEKANQTSLKYVARQYCNAPFWDEELKVWLSSDKKKINYGHIRPDVLAEYGCMDVFFTYQLSTVLPERVKREGTEVLVHNILLPAQRTFAEIEYEGIRIDVPYVKQLEAKWRPLIDNAISEVQEYARQKGFPADPRVTKNQIIRRICDCVPMRLRSELGELRVTSYGKYLREQHGLLARCEICNNKRYVREVDNTLNVRSSTQMAHICHDMFEMIPTFKPRQCDKQFWEINAGHPFAELVVAYRELDYLQRNFVEGMQGFLWEDGRVHPDIFVAGTVSGRLSMKSPALQTVPSRSKRAKFVKRMFLPDEGDLIVNVDYKALEMFVTHHLTKDPQLLEDLTTRDIYKATAQDIFRKAYEEVTAEERKAVKPVVLASGYNIKAGKLSKNPDIRKTIGGGKEKAQEMLDAFWARYKVWNDVKEGWKQEAVRTGVLTTEFGRKRRWSLVTADNLWKVENQATNFKSQSTGSDICLTSVIKLTKLLKDKGYGRVLLTVHDSIVFSIHKQNVHEAVRLIEEVMTNVPVETDTPFFVDTGIGPDYAYACDEEKGGYDPTRDYTTWSFE